MLAILVNSGLGLKKTLLFNFIPILLSYAGFTAGVFLDNLDESYDQYIFAISSGMYFYIFLGTLVFLRFFNVNLRPVMHAILEKCMIFKDF